MYDFSLFPLADCHTAEFAFDRHNVLVATTDRRTPSAAFRGQDGSQNASFDDRGPHGQIDRKLRKTQVVTAGDDECVTFVQFNARTESLWD